MDHRTNTTVVIKAETKLDITSPSASMDLQDSLHVVPSNHQVRSGCTPNFFSRKGTPRKPRKRMWATNQSPHAKAFNKSTNKNTLRSKDLQRPPHFEHRARPRVENIWDQNWVAPHPKMNQSPLKRDHLKRKIIFQLSCFRGHVSFLGCKHPFFFRGKQCICWGDSFI